MTPIDIHETCPTVTVTDTKTGDIAERSDISIWGWTEGNWACDCNRGLMFGNQQDNCSTSRYRVTNVSPMPDGYTLDEFNDGYNDDQDQ
jgi:hypothetical protein